MVYKRDCRIYRDSGPPKKRENRFQFSRNSSRAASTDSIVTGRRDEAAPASLTSSLFLAQFKKTLALRDRDVSEASCLIKSAWSSSSCQSRVNRCSESTNQPALVCLIRLGTRLLLLIRVNADS